MVKSQVNLLIILSIIIILVHGCTPMDKITYLNNSQLESKEISTVPPKHHLEIGDILIVKVISRNEESNDLFNVEPNNNSSAKITDASLYLNGFTISQEGTIDIPNLGKINILNQTLEEAEKTILSKAEEYVKDPFVVVKLANFEITILGEVNMPGRYPVYKQGLTNECR